MGIKGVRLINNLSGGGSSIILKGLRPFKTYPSPS